MEYIFLISGISLVFMSAGCFLGYVLSRRSSKKDINHLAQLITELEVRKLKNKIAEIEEEIKPKKAVLLTQKKRGRKSKMEIV